MIFSFLIEIIAKIKTKTNNAVLEVQYNKGKKKYSQIFKLKYKEFDIIIKQSSEYKHLLNKVAERYISLIKTKIKSILYKVRLSYKF